MENGYAEIKNNAYKNYKKIKKIYCPYLKKYIYFTSKGFWHIIYTARNSKRDRKSQLQRFKLLTKAIKLLRLTATLQEYEEILSQERKVYYFGFIAIFQKDKIKVIVKKIGKGKFHFWSVVPNWITSKKRDRKLFKGNLEHD